MATGYGLLTVEGDEHKAMRKMMTPAFSNASLAQQVPDYYPDIQTAIDLLKKAIDQEGDGDSTVLDIYPRMSHLTLDIICQTAFGALLSLCLSAELRLAQATSVTRNAIQKTSLQCIMSASSTCARFVP